MKNTFINQEVNSNQSNEINANEHLENGIGINTKLYERRQTLKRWSIKKGFIFCFLMFSITGISLNSCKKDKNEFEHSKNFKDLNNFRIFASMDDLFQEVQKVNLMDDMQLEAYEQSVNFLSFGRTADQLYSSLIQELGIEGKLQEGGENNEDNNDNAEARLTIARITQYALDNSQYVQLEKDDDGELCFVTRLENSLFRYVINQDQIVRVGDRLWKVLENGIVEALVDSSKNANGTNNNVSYYYKILLTITDNNVSSVVKQYPNISYTPSIPPVQKGNYGRSITEDKKNNAKKERLWYWIGIMDYKVVNSEIVYRGVELNIRSYHKTLGIWWYCKRTINANFSGWVVLDVSGIRYPFSDNFTQFHRLIVKDYLPKTYTRNPNPYIYSASGSIWISLVNISINKP
jgi:hypothetical protein